MGILAALGEVPHKCPMTCKSEFHATALGCRGPVENAIFSIELPDGTLEPIHECPHQILRRCPDVIRFVNDFGMLVENNILPGAGGLHDQPAVWVDALRVASTIRGRELEKRRKASEAAAKG